MSRPDAQTQGDGNRGRWLVIGLIALAVILGIVGLSMSRWLRPRAESEVPAQDAPAGVAVPQPALLEAE